METGKDVEQGALSSLLLRHQCADRRLRIAYGRSAGIDAVRRARWPTCSCAT